jgi:hypothetical protein
MYEYINGNERDYENFGARRARNRVMVEKIWASKVLWANWSFQGGAGVYLEFIVSGGPWWEKTGEYVVIGQFTGAWMKFCQA